MYKQIETELKKHINQKKADFFPIFFKTGPGEYAAGDKFIGITVPNIRSVAKQFYKQTSLADVQKLLNSPIYEYRLVGLIILTYQYATNEKLIKQLNKQQSHFAEIKCKKIFIFYLKNTKKINNWDLVDLSAYKIVGAYLLDKDKNILYKLAKSKNLWEKRISIISTFAFIKNDDFIDTLKISEILLKDNHDLIHKAVGWMLREVGKIDRRIEETFLKKYYKKMPRTMLRYAIEKFPEVLRQKYLKNKI